MSLELYRFDSVKAFPVLESQSTARGRIDTVVAGRGDDMSLCVSLQRRPGEEGALTIAVALPVRAVEGALEGIDVEVADDDSGCRLFIDGGDPLGDTQSFDCGLIDHLGRGTCRWSGTVERSGEPARDGRVARRATIQFHRMRMIVPPEQAIVRLGLISVRVHGDVRLVASGLA